MQSIFAYEQCKEANYQLSLDIISNHFQPDLNSMEVQDKALLSLQRKEALKLFQAKINSGNGQGEEEVEQFVNNEIQHYHSRLEKDNNFLQSSLVRDLENLKQLYRRILGLVVALAEVAKADKKEPYLNFTENIWVKALQQHKEIMVENAAPGGWHSSADKVRAWFREVVRPDKDFQSFTGEINPNEESQLSIIKHLFRKLILTPGSIHDYFEEQDIHWAEDRDIVKSLVDKTIKSLNAENRSIKLQELSLDWDDDVLFINEMYVNTTNINPNFKGLIAANTKNWEVDRLPLTDRVILEMAIVELTTFPNIPVKVSINEYIELAKLYSTPKSKAFVNGILDVIAKELQSTGHIRKSGRGLIDNK